MGEPVMFCGECGAGVGVQDRFCVVCGSVLDSVVAGRFEVRGLVGRGESGVSFLTFDRVLERLVLMRELSPTVVADTTRFARLRAVTATLTGIADDHCVQVFSLTADTDPPLLFSEWVPGPSLRTVMTAGPLDAPAALVALDGALIGLDQLHHHGLAHGYPTPSRVLLDRAGRSKIADTGLGHGTKLSVETLMFCAPELITTADTTPDQACDIYAAGALLSALSTGRAPFPAATAEAALAARSHHPAGLDTLPGPLADIICDATATNPTDRLSSLAEFRSRLAHAAAATNNDDWAAAGAAILAGIATATGSATVTTAIATTAVAGAGAGAAGAGAAAGAGVAGTTAVGSTTAATATSTGAFATITANPLLVAAIAGTIAIAAGGSYALLTHTDNPPAAAVAANSSSPSAQPTTTPTVSAPPPPAKAPAPPPSPTFSAQPEPGMYYAEGTEKAALVEAINELSPGGWDAVGGGDDPDYWTIRVANSDPNWASAQAVNPRGNGYILLHKDGGSWQMEQGSPLFCSALDDFGAPTIVTQDFRQAEECNARG